MLDAGDWRLDLVLLRTMILHDIVFLSEIINEDLLWGKDWREQCSAYYF